MIFAYSKSRYLSHMIEINKVYPVIMQYQAPLSKIAFLRLRKLNGICNVIEQGFHVLQISSWEDWEMHKMLYPELDYSWGEKCLKEHLDAERKQ